MVSEIVLLLVYWRLMAEYYDACGKTRSSEDAYAVLSRLRRLNALLDRVAAGVFGILALALFVEALL